MQDLMSRTLEAYGVDLMNTPEDALVVVCRGWIEVEQFVRDEEGGTILNSHGDRLVTTGVRFPHPEED